MLEPICSIATEYDLPGFECIIPLWPFCGVDVPLKGTKDESIPCLLPLPLDGAEELPRRPPRFVRGILSIFLEVYGWCPLYVQL